MAATRRSHNDATAPSYTHFFPSHSGPSPPNHKAQFSAPDSALFPFSAESHLSSPGYFSPFHNSTSPDYENRLKTPPNWDLRANLPPSVYPRSPTLLPYRYPPTKSLRLSQCPRQPQHLPNAQSWQAIGFDVCTHPKKHKKRRTEDAKDDSENEIHRDSLHCLKGSTRVHENHSLKPEEAVGAGYFDTSPCSTASGSSTSRHPGGFDGLTSFTNFNDGGFALFGDTSAYTQNETEPVWDLEFPDEISLSERGAFDLKGPYAASSSMPVLNDGVFSANHLVDTAAVAQSRTCGDDLDESSLEASRLFQRSGNDILADLTTALPTKVPAIATGRPLLDLRSQHRVDGGQYGSSGSLVRSPSGQCQAYAGKDPMAVEHKREEGSTDMNGGSNSGVPFLIVKSQCASTCTLKDQRRKLDEDSVPGSAASETDHLGLACDRNDTMGGHRNNLSNNRYLKKSENSGAEDSNHAQRPALNEQNLIELNDISYFKKTEKFRKLIVDYSEGISFPLGEGGRELLRACLNVKGCKGRQLQGASVPALLGLAKRWGLWDVAIRIKVERSTGQLCDFHEKFVRFKATQSQMRKYVKKEYMVTERGFDGKISKIVYDENRKITLGKEGREALRAQLRRLHDKHPGKMDELLSLHGFKYSELRNATVQQLSRMAFVCNLWDQVVHACRKQEEKRDGKYRDGSLSDDGAANVLLVDDGGADPLSQQGYQVSDLDSTANASSSLMDSGGALELNMSTDLPACKREVTDDEQVADFLGSFLQINDAHSGTTTSELNLKLECGDDEAPAAASTDCGGRSDLAIEDALKYSHLWGGSEVVMQMLRKQSMSNYPRDEDQIFQTFLGTINALEDPHVHAMLDARDWILRNVLFLDPSLYPFGNEQTQVEEGGVAPSAAADAAAGESEILPEYLQPFPCQLELGGRCSPFKVRCSKSPEPAIIICSEGGDQLRALTMESISQGFKINEKKIALILSKPQGEGEEGAVEIQADLEFRTTTDCAIFCRALQVLYSFKIQPRIQHKMREQAQAAPALPLTVSDVLIIKGTGCFGDSLALLYGNPELSTGGLFPFQSTRIYLAENVGGLEIAYNKEVAMCQNVKTFTPTALCAGRYISVDAVVHQKALVSKKSKNRLRASLGPILPSDEVALELLNNFAQGSRVLVVSVSSGELLDVLQLNRNVPESILRDFRKIAYTQETVRCQMKLSNQGFVLIIPVMTYSSLQLLWSECLLCLPKPTDDEGLLIARLTRELAFGFSMKFLNEDGSEWISLNVETMQQVDRDVIWHTGMFFLLHRKIKQSELHKWEAQRAQGATSYLMNKFRLTWSKVDGSTLFGLVDIPGWWAATQEVVLESPAAVEEGAKVQREKRTLLSTTMQAKAEATVEGKPPSETVEDILYTPEPQDKPRGPKEVPAWSSPESSELSSESSEQAHGRRGTRLSKRT